MLTKVLNWKTILILFIIYLLYLINPSVSLAGIGPNPGDECVPGDPAQGGNCDGKPGYSCLPAPPPNKFVCQRDVFGKIQAPSPLAGFLAKNPTGTSAISQFLSNFVVLFFSVAAIALLFMILWGAFEWLVSGGDKEKLASAQRRILHAFIGMILIAAAFAVIRLLGQFTGFTFFTESNTPPKENICKLHPEKCLR